MRIQMDYKVDSHYKICLNVILSSIIITKKHSNKNLSVHMHMLQPNKKKQGRNKLLLKS